MIDNSRADMESNRILLIVFLSILLSSTCSRAKYEPAGCSDEGCGIPCYMRPVEDPCHYQPHSPCNEEGSTDLEQWVQNLNSSLHRLENKLIQKGVSKLKLNKIAASELWCIIYHTSSSSTHKNASYTSHDDYSIHAVAMYSNVLN